MGEGVAHKVTRVIRETLDDEEFPTDPSASLIAHANKFEVHDGHSPAAVSEEKARQH